MFVLIVGKSRDQAFIIGQEIADKVTSSNPKPIKLKLEKVYMGCALISKKRYTGYKYESPNELKGALESKGIETIRCLLVSTIMKRCLNLVFLERDIFKVRQTIENTWRKMQSGRIPLNHYIFSKEVRLGTYSEKGSLPPAALVSTKSMKMDPQAVPGYGERIAYVVINSPPKSRLIDLVVDPKVFLNLRNTYTINIYYYITKQIIPSLERIFCMVGVDINEWYRNFPKISTKSLFKKLSPIKSKFYAAAADISDQSSTIDQYFPSQHCLCCNELGVSNLCKKCKADKQGTVYTLKDFISDGEAS